MRIFFSRPSQPEIILKTCKRVLAANLPAPDGVRLPTQSVRNALCRGLGYSSYDEFRLVTGRRPEGDDTLPALDDLHGALTQGFSLALAVAEERGFRLPEPSDAFARRLAGEVVRDWSARLERLNPPSHS